MSVKKLTVAILTITFIAGCSRNSPEAPSLAPLSISPVDDAAGVRLDGTVQLDFGAPVERDVVERGLRLIGEFNMVSVPRSSIAGTPSRQNHPLTLTRWESLVPEEGLAVRPAEVSRPPDTAHVRVPVDGTWRQLGGPAADPGALHGGDDAAVREALRRGCLG